MAKWGGYPVAEHSLFQLKGQRTLNEQHVAKKKKKKVYCFAPPRVSCGISCEFKNYIHFEKQKTKWVKSWKKKFSMAFKYKFNPFILPYPQLHVTGDREVTLEKVSLQLCIFPTFFSSLYCRQCQKSSQAFINSGLPHHSCSSPHQWHFCYVSCNKKEFTSRQPYMHNTKHR